MIKLSCRHIIKIAETLTMYHGSPYGGLKSFDNIRPPIFFTIHEQTARDYAIGTVLGAQRDPGGILEKVPTIYKVQVSTGNNIDFRNKDDREFYIEARKAYFAEHKDDENRFRDYPRIDAEGFVSSRTGVPMYSNYYPLLALFNKSGRHPDSIWLDEGSQGISLAMIEPRGKIQIIDSYLALK